MYKADRTLWKPKYHPCKIITIILFCGGRIPFWLPLINIGKLLGGVSMDLKKRKTSNSLVVVVVVNPPF
jgi:hypothetical protein